MPSGGKAVPGHSAVSPEKAKEQASDPVPAGEGSNVLGNFQLFPHTHSREAPSSHCLALVSHPVGMQCSSDLWRQL